MIDLGSFPLTVTVKTMGYRSYKNPLNKAPLRTVTGRGNDPRSTELARAKRQALHIGLGLCHCSPNGEVHVRNCIAIGIPNIRARIIPTLVSDAAQKLPCHGNPRMMLAEDDENAGGGVSV